MSVFLRSPIRASISSLFRAYPHKIIPIGMRAFTSKSSAEDSDSGRTHSTTQRTNPATDNTNASAGDSDSSKDGSSSAKPLGKVSGIVNSILHGSGSLPKVQSQESWGLSLARGKYVHELQKHRIRPERFDDYVELVSEAFPRMVKESNNRLRLTGSWLTEIGQLDTAVHIWEFDGYAGHVQEMDRLRKDLAYQKFLKDLRPLLISRDNQICLEFAFWKSRPPVALGGIYEMRTYLLKPGNLLEWETNWRRGLECRRQFCEPVGAWFSQLGELNYVHHMWNYPDLETRKKTREQAWKVDGWAETVYNTVRLIERMEANILLPMGFSSLK
ncbi:hypothetical protein BX616_001294 [Lobosporangium transversale]|uniref:NIPSNAP domain-containing protein n=1 Tax=Lobosporangium transversale TaxID=64571 RepID=A0A1Y2GK05_9FUNG|nr:hypothetical protein BCR41DRAFT_355509 [Lobosporangium transversale]KAF9917351.1 hypothetical protein BX616_001294 [Lobosporangium transversale]ORZ13360.1 hypothetical protein BCR41DRAFT_355509 [Lobosporangium transversale]|eukprot:XP_021880441.1 hypothetical protein BCR41DRAFT_355509 [Lobosporangium transversale]